MLRFEWFGQACVKIDDNVSIVTDPHDGDSVGLKEPDAKGDIISISHQHFDHASGKDLVSKGGSMVVDRAGKREVKGVKIEGIESYHDKSKGSKRGENIIFKYNLDGFHLCHLGDLGHKLSEEKVEKIKSVDVLMIPVGGNYTINAQEAIEVIEDLEPKVVIPIHYKVKNLKVDISSEEEFLKLAEERGWDIEDKVKAEIEDLPETRKVIRLECQS